MKYVGLYTIVTNKYNNKANKYSIKTNNYKNTILTCYNIQYLKFSF